MRRQLSDRGPGNGGTVSSEQQQAAKKERPVIGFAEKVIVMVLIAIQAVLGILATSVVPYAYVVPIIVIIIGLGVLEYALITGKLKLFG